MFHCQTTSVRWVCCGTNIQPNSNIVKIRLRITGYLNATSVPESCIISLTIEEAIYSIDPSDNTVLLRVATLSDQQVTLRPNSILLEFNLLKDELYRRLTTGTCVRTKLPLCSYKSKGKIPTRNRSLPRGCAHEPTWLSHHQ